MFKQYLKPLLIAGCSLLMLAGCGNQTATTTTATTAASSNPLEGKWEQIDFRSTLERGLGYESTAYKTPEKLIYADAFKDVTPTLTITGDSAVYDITTTTNAVFGNYYDYLKAKNPTKVKGSKEEYIKSEYNRLKKHLETFNGMKGPTSFEFKNAPMFINLVTFSGEKFIRPVTYKYTLEDGILTLSFEEKQDLDNGDTVSIYFTLRFKKVAE